MKNYNEIREIIENYSIKYRNPSLDKIEVSELYDLFPDKNTDHNVELKWPKSVWPFCGRSGAYLYLDDDLNIMYIGKANHFGYRFGQCFKKDANGSCIVIDSRIGSPRFVVTIAVPAESWFEAASLEAYLINLIKPRYNSVGKY